MINDVTLAQAACLDIYNPAANWDDLWTIEGITVARRWINGDNIIVFEGSHNQHDFEVDAECLLAEVLGIGTFHRGFYEGLDAVMDQIASKVGRGAYITGHSLGGGRTYQFAAMLAKAGMPARAAVAFAPPRPGFADLRDYLVMSGTLLRGYHNAFDPIPDVPTFPFCQPCPLTGIAVACDPEDPDPVFRYHHGPLYFAGVSALNGGVQ